MKIQSREELQSTHLGYRVVGCFILVHCCIYCLPAVRLIAPSLHQVWCLISMKAWKKKKMPNSLNKMYLFSTADFGLTSSHKDCSEAKLRGAKEYLPPSPPTPHTVVRCAIADSPSAGLGMDFPLPAVSVSFVWYSKMPQTGWLAQQKFISHSCAGWEVQRSQSWLIWFLGRKLFFVMSSYGGERGWKKALSCLFV